jgi:hypothetical protein
MHGSKMYICSGPDDCHAYDVIPEARKTDDFEHPCPTCHGHGQWNKEIDFASFRSIRVICEHCHGSGWIETGDHLDSYPDIIMSPTGNPMWITRTRSKD